MGPVSHFGISVMGCGGCSSGEQDCVKYVRCIFVVRRKFWSIVFEVHLKLI